MRTWSSMFTFSGVRVTLSSLLDDNARSHRALLVDEFLEKEDIHRREWSAMSIHLNPIGMSGTLWRGQLRLETPSQNHPGNENSVAERVGSIST
ncbi:transposable element Tc1 transposase [Trichonephila clavipes]|nr:transposable element Tc1 transposase [Trichonephila clavipes]